MRAVIQKVTCAQVDVLLEEGRETVGRVSDGLMVLLGMGLDDDENDARYIADKTAGLRIFEDAAGKLNLSLQDTGGAVLLVSQFTLYADARSGRRPSRGRSRRSGCIWRWPACCARTVSGWKRGVSRRICRCRCATTGRLRFCWTRKKRFEVCCASHYLKRKER